MKKEVLIIIFLFMISLISAGPTDNEGTPDPDLSSPLIIILETYDAPAEYPEGLTYDGTYIWSTSILDQFIFKHDPNTGEVISKIPSPGGGTMDLAWDGEYLWNADYDVNKIYKLDTNGNILKEFDTPGEQPMGLTWDGEYLWHTDYTLKQIYKMDTDGNILSQFDAPGQKPHGLAWDGEYLWNSDAVTYNIYKLDTSGNILEKYYFPYSYPTGLALQGEFLWMAARDTGKIYKLKIPGESSSGLADSPWPTFRGNLKNTGLSPYDTSHIDGTQKWMFKPSSDSQLLFESSPTIGPDGTIYVGSHDNNLYAVNSDGTQKWVFDAGDPVLIEGGISGGYTKGMQSSPAISSDGTIYIRSFSNYLFALNPDGTEKWKFPMKVSADTWSSPTIGNDGTIYVGSAREGNEGGRVYAINPDGTEKWNFKAQSDVFPTMAIDDDGTIYSGAGGDGEFFALNPDGTVKWRFSTGRHTESSVAIGSDGTLYFGNWDNKIYALDSNGNKKWEFLTGGEGIVASPAIAKEGTIYFNADDGYLYAFNPDGILKWKYDVGDPAESSSSPTIGSDGTIYVGVPWQSDKLNFLAINPNGTLKWGQSIGGISASPSIGEDGTVYISTHSGLYAFGGSEEEAVPELIAEPENESEEDLLEGEEDVKEGFFARIANWFKKLFSKNKISKVSEKSLEEICLTNEEYAEVTDPNAPVLSLPFNIEDYYTKHWGIVPFCAELRNSGIIHGAFDFELKPDSKVFAATDGVIEHTQVGKEEGSGEIISVEGDGFKIGYSGLTNLQVKAGDEIKKGDYIANVVQIPHGEYHVHMGITINGREECPLKYMDQEFKDAFEQMFAQADYQTQTSAPCACNCESLVPNY